ncbi:MAG: MarC family protein [Myxococcota bacterium]
MGFDLKDFIVFSSMAFSTIFFVVDPIGLIPIFISMTQSDSEQKRISIAKRATIAAGLILLVFAVFGKLIFSAFGITLAAFRIAGGVLLWYIAMDMVRARTTRVKTTPEEEREGVEKEDVALIPLALPMLSGPGSISTVMVLMGQAKNWLYVIPVFISIFLTCLITYFMLKGAQYLLRYLKQTGLKIIIRIMGMILAAIAIQFIINGVYDAIKMYSLVNY